MNLTDPHVSLPRISVGLVHHPILDSARNVVATNITNLDVHDIARACKVYGVDRYYLIHPMKEQQMFVWRMLDHWRTGEGSKFNSMRRTALTMVHTADSVPAAVQDWAKASTEEVSPETSRKTWVIGTSARKIDVPRKSFLELKTQLKAGDRVFLLFGTGFGMTEELLKSCDFLLEPLTGAPPLDYRHLSVRSAVSICLDRLLGS
jgi:hypothetical protein